MLNLSNFKYVHHCGNISQYIKLFFQKKRSNEWLFGICHIARLSWKKDRLHLKCWSLKYLLFQMPICLNSLYPIEIFVLILAFSIKLLVCFPLLFESISIYFPLQFISFFLLQSVSFSALLLAFLSATFHFQSFTLSVLQFHFF